MPDKYSPSYGCPISAVDLYDDREELSKVRSSSLAEASGYLCMGEFPVTRSGVTLPPESLRIAPLGNAGSGFNPFMLSVAARMDD